MVNQSLSALSCHVAYATHSPTRHYATSGGVGSTLIAYLFHTGRIQTSLTFDFDRKTLEYKPKLIYRAEDYLSVGSIYHEIDLVNFIKEHLDKIKGGFACFALPCQIAPLHRLLQNRSADTYLIQLTCSSQQSSEATRYLLSRLGVAPEEVEYIRYRGVGWPGGVLVRKTDNTEVFADNVGSVWTKVFHSQLFWLPKCFNCPPEFPNSKADIILADPWRIDNPEKEKEGRTLCLLQNARIQKIWKEMGENGLIEDEVRDLSCYKYAQEGPLIRKRNDKYHRKSVFVKKKLIHSPLYRKMMLCYPWAFNAHCVGIRLLNKIFKTIHSKELL